MASLTYMQLIRSRRGFRCLLAGQVVSELGNWFNFIAGLGLVRVISNGAPEVTAMLVVARMLPFAFLAPVAGAFVDRWSRRTVMIASDVSRAVFALGFLLVRRPEDLWIAYACTVVSTLFSAFFEAAKNASLPNVAGDRGLLAGNALMHSSRFLLMSVGAVLGGWASAAFGYEAAFVINAASFLVSAFSIWLIPERELHATEDARGRAGATGVVVRAGRFRVWTDLREGWKYVAQHRLVAAIIGINVVWATGGGASYLVYDRLGVELKGGWQGDEAVAALYSAVGVGLFIGMMLARRVGSHVELHGVTPAFIGWTLIVHGLLFALAGLMPTLWLASLMLLLSRVLIGVEFAVQETLMMRLLPDGLRARVFTNDRAAEIGVMSLSTAVAGWALTGGLTARALAIITGLLAAMPGVGWLALFAAGKLRLPPEVEQASKDDEAERVAVASAG